MRVVLAPDSFKGTVAAAEVAQALTDGWRSRRPDDHLTIRPMADGGEGTLAAVAAAHPGTARHRVGGCTGPDGRPVDGEFALLADGTAVVDEALASADRVITGEGRFDATSLRGKAVGEVLARAERAGVPCRIVAGDSADGSVLTLTGLAGSTRPACAEVRHWLRQAGALLAAEAAGCDEGQDRP